MKDAASTVLLVVERAYFALTVYHYSMLLLVRKIAQLPFFSLNFLILSHTVLGIMIVLEIMIRLRWFLMPNGEGNVQSPNFFIFEKLL